MLKASRGADLGGQAWAHIGDSPSIPTLDTPKAAQRKEPFAMPIECDFHRRTHSVQSHDPSV